MKSNRLLFAIVLTITVLGCQKEAAPPPDGLPASVEALDLPGMPTYDAEALARELNEPAYDVSLRDGHVVEVPAGSSDALAAAIAEAGEGGTVVLLAGEHYESQPVLIEQSVKIVGEDGARLISTGTQPTDAAGILQPALHVLGAAGVVIRNLQIAPDKAPGGTGILLERAPRAQVRNNELEGFQFGILNERSDRARIMRNHVVTTSAWQTGEIFDAHGIVNINGRNVWIVDNEVSNSVLGIWACDRGGFALSNRMSGNLIGFILCNVPAGLYPLPDGTFTGSETPGTTWLVQNNTSNDNLSVGVLVIDGARSNYVINNSAAGNGDYDTEVAGDSERFGFFTPTSAENFIYIFEKEQTVKDCGHDNTVYGGTTVDTAAEPCF